MQLTKTIYKGLCSFVKGLPAVDQTMARSYGLSIFAKTRFYSHLSFLRKCLDKDVIPNGFRISRSSNVSSYTLSRQTERATETCSRRLMRIAVRDFSARSRRADQNLIKAKEYFEETQPVQYSSLKRVVYELNSKLHNELQITKERKFKKLLPVLPPRANRKSVVCIPENLDISDSERDVLSKGLKFIHTPSQTNETEVNFLLERFYRRVKLHAYFNDPNESSTDLRLEEDPFLKYNRKPSDWVPPTTPPAVEAFIERCREEVGHVDMKPKRRRDQNLTREEQQALQKLRNRLDIIIKPADKGGAVVVWRKDLYIQEAQSQLSDSSFYMKTTRDLTLDNLKIVNDSVQDEISLGNLPATASNLIPVNPRCSRFYLLPKIHKPENPGRPVVSACCCPTEFISAFIDDVLKPLVSQLPSYVKDTNHLLNILKDIPRTTEKRLLFTMDVKSLYTVIPNDDGLRALRFFLEQRTEQSPPTETVIRLAELVLTLNHFEFDSEFYTQIRGVSMGTRMGPSYACLFMGFLEHQFFQTYDGPIPEVYRRYIDDGVGSSVMAFNDLEKFIVNFNDFHYAVKFTWKITDTSLECLDVKMSVQEGDISTSIYYKPTDSHSYLRYDSHHPPKCIDSIPFSQFLRLRRICSSDADFVEKSEEMSEFFYDRGYPTTVVKAALERCKGISRSEALVQRDKRNGSKIPLVLPYQRSTAKISKIIHANAKILSRDSDTGSLFRDNIVTAYKNLPNFRQILVRSKLPSNEIPGTFPCRRPRCKTCAFVSQSEQIIGPTGNYAIKQSFTCTSTGVVYAITCLKCSALYIGETGRKLADRFREHLRDVRVNSTSSDVAVHFNSPGHDSLDLSVCCLATITGMRERRLKEAKLIRRLGTLHPLGLNREEDSNHKTH